MRPLRNHPLLLLNSEFSSHNTKVTAILFALAPADFAPLRPPMPAHACIQLHYRRLPAAIRLFVRLCRLTPAYGSRNAIGSWPIRVAIALLPKGHYALFVALLASPIRRAPLCRRSNAAPATPGLESRNARDRWAKKIPHSDEERGIGERCANLNYVLQYPPLTQVKLAFPTVQSLLLLHETLQDPPAHTMPLGQSAALLHG